MTSVTTIGIDISTAGVLTLHRCSLKNTFWAILGSQRDLLSDRSSSLLASAYHRGLLHMYGYFSPTIAFQIDICRLSILLRS